MSWSLPPSSRSEPTRKILKTQGPVPLGWLYKTAEVVKHDLATYQLTEVQLWKDSHNLGHEVLLGEFKNWSEVVYIGTERFAQEVTSVKNIIKPILRAFLQTGKLAIYEPPTVRADDSFWIMPDVQSFRDAIDYIVKSDEFRANDRYVERGTAKYNLDNMSSTKTPSKSNHAREPYPNIMDFIHAVYIANRTRPYYTPTGSNCFWFAGAILYILDQTFPPSGQSKVYHRQGVFFGVPLGRLSKPDHRTLLNHFDQARDYEAPVEPIKKEAKQKEWVSHVLDEWRRTVSEARTELYETRSTRRILKAQGPIPLDWLHKTAEIVEDDLATYRLTELRLWKDSSSVRHEILVGEFRNRSKVVYIGTERRAMEVAKAKNIIKPILRASLRTGTLDSYESQTIRADDSFWIMPDVQSFRCAMDYILESDDTRADAEYVECCTVKYNLDNMPSAETSSKSSHTREPYPSIMDFIHAVYAANRTRPYYSPTGSNCFWFARAILYILNQKFFPSEKCRVSNRPCVSFRDPTGRLPKPERWTLLNHFDELINRDEARDHEVPEGDIEIPGRGETKGVGGETCADRRVTNRVRGQNQAV